MNSATAPNLSDNGSNGFNPLSRYFLLGFGLLILLLAWLGKSLNPFLSYDRAAVLSGQIWRLLSGNFMHLSVNHALLNLATLTLAVLLFKNLRSAHWWLFCSLACCVSVGLGLLVFDSEVTNYVGLSGALYGILCCGLLLGAAEQARNRWIYLLIFIYISGKVISQQLSSFDANYLQKFIDGRVVASSHLYGMLCGISVALASTIRHFKQEATRS